MANEPILVVDTTLYTLSPIQLENLAAEYLGICGEAAGPGIEITFETLKSMREFSGILENTFKR